jgi:hypothetical protein
MMLNSARFHGIVRLEDIRAEDTTQYLRSNDQGPEVAAVQGALIDAGFSIPDGDTGYFGAQTAAAVHAFKEHYQLYPSDPVVGIQTMTTLDDYFALPTADRREWREQYGRPAQGGNPPLSPRPLPDWNFSRFKEQTRRTNGLDFTFNPAGMVLNGVIGASFLAGLHALLDPAGSPSGPMMPCATWGASPFDLYHVHLAIRDYEADLAPAFSNHQNTFRNQIQGLTGLGEPALPGSREAFVRTANASGLAMGSEQWTSVYKGLLLSADDNGKTIAQRTLDWLDAVLQTGTETGIPVRFIWHTFESLSGKWRPDGMTKSDPRRSWWNEIGATSTVTQTPFPATPESPSQWVDLGQLAFAVNDAAVVTVMPCDFREAGAINDIPMQLVEQLD